MTQVILNNLHSSIIETLKILAQRNNRSLEEELEVILIQTTKNEAIEKQNTFNKAWAKIDAARQQHQGKFFSDSVELLREDRQR